MFLKNSWKASKSIHARIAIFVNCAVMIDAEFALVQKNTNAKNLPRNKFLLCFSLKMRIKDFNAFPKYFESR
jgi:hypothetical protein